jgi:hypothetical protein
MPNFASRYQSGNLYAESDLSVGWNGPRATPNPSGAGIGAGAGGNSEAEAPTTAASATSGTRLRQAAGAAAAKSFNAVRREMDIRFSVTLNQKW